MYNNIIVVVLKQNCNIKCLNSKQIGQPPKHRPAMGQTQKSYKNRFLFQKECGQPYDFLHLADRPMMLTYDDSFVLSGLIVVPKFAKHFYLITT